MNPTKTRLLDLGTSWEDSEAPVTLTTSDALALGVKAPAGKPPTIKGREILPRAHALPDDADAMPDGSEPTPNQQSEIGDKLTQEAAAAKTKEAADKLAKEAAAAKAKEAADKLAKEAADKLAKRN